MNLLFKTLPLGCRKTRQLITQTQGKLYWPIAYTTAFAYFMTGCILVSIATFT